jgi:hypothetical protein
VAVFPDRVLKRRAEIPNDISNLWRVNKVARGGGVVTDIIFVTGERENLMGIDFVVRLFFW